MALFTDYQKAVIALLKADATLTALVPAARISEAPADTLEYPHMWVEEAGGEDWSTKTEIGVKEELVLHVGSRYNGTKELKQIGERVHTLLHFVTLVLDSGQSVVAQFDRYNIIPDQDGVTRHGVFRYQFLISEG